MKKHAWVQEFPGAITVCGPEGIIMEMNDESVETFQDEGGEGLIGTNLLDCHPEPARTELEGLLETQQANVYTTESEGTKKLIYQVPWYEDGTYGGFVELSLKLPAHMPHFIRDG